MDLDCEVMKKAVGTVEKCLKDLFNKSDLTPAETKAALDGMELREWLLCEIENCKMQDDQKFSERGYSGHNMPYRRYNITAYDGPRSTSVMQSGRSHRDMYSGDYGVEGWYRSNCGPYERPMYDDQFYYERMPHGSVSTRGYSRHSIGDRVVEKLEQMMDTTESEYEREELRKFMHMVREAAD